MSQHPPVPPKPPMPPVPGASSSNAVPREDLHPKVKAGIKTYAAVGVAGAIAAIAAAQQSMDLSPLLALVLGLTGGALPLVAGFLKAGDGR